MKQIEKGIVMYAAAKVIRRRSRPGALQTLGYLCILEAKDARDMQVRTVPTSIFRVKFEPKRIRCIILGKSYRHTGQVRHEDTGDGYLSYFDRDGGSLEVWIVEPFPDSQRYYEPIAILEEDLSYDIDAPIHEILNY